MTLTTPSPNQVITNPELFARAFLKIQDKSMRTIPFIYNEVQRHYLAHRTPRDLILKPRQKGATTVVQSEFSRYCWTRPTSTLTLGKDDENTKELRRISEFFYQELPENFRPQNSIVLRYIPKPSRKRGVLIPLPHC